MKRLVLFLRFVLGFAYAAVVVALRAATDEQGFHNALLPWLSIDWVRALCRQPIADKWRFLPLIFDAVGIFTSVVAIPSALLTPVVVLLQNPQELKNFKSSLFLFWVVVLYHWFSEYIVRKFYRIAFSDPKHYGLYTRAGARVYLTQKTITFLRKSLEFHTVDGVMHVSLPIVPAPTSYGYDRACMIHSMVLSIAAFAHVSVTDLLLAAGREIHVNRDKVVAQYVEPLAVFAPPMDLGDVAFAF